MMKCSDCYIVHVAQTYLIYLQCTLIKLFINTIACSGEVVEGTNKTEYTKNGEPEVHECEEGTIYNNDDAVCNCVVNPDFVKTISDGKHIYIVQIWTFIPSEYYSLV